MHTELARRLGPVNLDLRTVGDSIGPWRSAAHAAWPAAVDATVDLTEHFGDTDPPLTSLFARTVDDRAASVRRRMLHHLGLLPIETFDDNAYSSLDQLSLRPTDLWLIVANAASVTVTGRDVMAFGAPSDDEGHAMLDARFEALATMLAPHTPAGDRLATVQSERDALAAGVDRMQIEQARTQIEATERFDQLAGEMRVLRERLERAELTRDLNGPS